MLIIYATVIILNTWRLIYNENKDKSLIDIKNIYVNGFLFATILINFILAGVFVLMAKKSFETYASHRIKYIEFYKNLSSVKAFKKVQANLNYDDVLSHFKAFVEEIFFIKSQKGQQFSDWANLELIQNSIFKLESFYYTKYLSFIMTAVYMCCIGVLTFCFIMLEIV